MIKPILIGMNNPVSSAVGHELYPLPDGCTGNRIWKMLDAASREKFGARVMPSAYLERFERRNLVRAKTYDPRTARANAGMIRQELEGKKSKGVDVLLFGREVLRAFGIPPVADCGVIETTIGGVTWYYAPHPSGRNLYYNEPRNWAAVGSLLLELFCKGEAT